MLWMSVFSNYYNYAFQCEVVIRQESLATTSGVQHQYVALNTASPNLIYPCSVTCMY